MPPTRSDGVLVPHLGGLRRILPFLLRGRNESAFYFEQTLHLERTLPWLEAREAKLFHLILAALARVLHERPQLNRFVAGRRLWQRPTIRVAFAVKRARSDEGTLTDVVLDLDPRWSLATLGAAVEVEVGRLRTGTAHASERDADLFLRLPRPLLDLAVSALRWLDFLGLAPTALTRDNPLYASVFLANLGSVGLDAGFHHLFEMGTCPIFAVIGRVGLAPWVMPDGTVQAQRCVRVCYTFDERVADGFTCGRSLERLRQLIEDPAEWLSAGTLTGVDAPTSPPPAAR